MIYLATPYTHPDETVRERRFHAAVKLAGRLMLQGVDVFSPIVHSHPIATAGGPNWDRHYWYRWSLEMLNPCDGLLVATMGGWRESKGVKAEIDYMRERGRRVRFVDPSAETLQWTVEP